MHSDIWLTRNRRIWATAHQIELSEERLRDVVEGVTGKRSISGLSERQQAGVIEALDILKGKMERQRRRRKQRIDGTRGAQATYRQIREVRRLSEALGWGRPALRAWLKRCFRTEREEWLTASAATKAIQGLKEMVERERGTTVTA